ncbi:hypothetical protein CIK69_02615 [Brachybacterium alimentarium]|uniref:Uncharacterized protein n=1 Tax=Brachybacterium alimentarium TaxID=47845 RepID=A0A2A3YLE5_9MICO|nr:hypothetical protein [Brachybacterium alimentarium]PCC40049.1 hypothetical protein CIK66_05225 [Brachybacterium alimentarium]RCS93138.1 hypothetical protein CIK69_02615 [Brachybacterium alimentarium]
MTHQPTRPAGTRRPLILLIAGFLIAALLLTLLAVGTVTYLVLSTRPEPAAAPEFPTYQAPTPMTEVDTGWYTFSYPAHWAPQDPTEDISSFDYVLTTLDAADNSKMAVMDYVVEDGIEEECQDQAEALRLHEMPDVEVDGRVAAHYQTIAPAPDTEETMVQDLWCLPRQFHIVVVLGRTSGPEAEAAGVSEAQKVLDTWSWTTES